MEQCKPHDRLRPVFVIAYIVYLACLVWLSLAPSLPSLPGLLAWDKLQHAGAYGLMTLLGGLAMGYDRRAGWYYSALVAVAFGGFMEILQGACTVNRSADWFDLAADAVGAATMIAVVTLVISRLQRNQL